MTIMMVISVSGYVQHLFKGHKQNLAVFLLLFLLQLP